jgi:hypothetical protein
LEVSSTVPGRTTTDAVPMREPRQSVMKLCLSCSSVISPLSPTMARNASITAGVTGVVGIGG